MWYLWCKFGLKMNYQKQSGIYKEIPLKIPFEGLR